MALMDIPDLGRTIRSVARVLRVGGRFVFSIVHPCYHGHVVITDDYMLDHRYLKREPVDWLPPHAYHRPIAHVVNELVGAGFTLERMVEVHVRPEDAGGVPGLLYARCVVAYS